MITSVIISCLNFPLRKWRCAREVERSARAKTTGQFPSQPTRPTCLIAKRSAYQLHYPMRKGKRSSARATSADDHQPQEPPEQRRHHRKLGRPAGGRSQQPIINGSSNLILITGRIWFTLRPPSVLTTVFLLLFSTGLFTFTTAPSSPKNRSSWWTSILKSISSLVSLPIIFNDTRWYQRICTYVFHRDALRVTRNILGADLDEPRTTESCVIHSPDRTAKRSALLVLNLLDGKRTFVFPAVQSWSDPNRCCMAVQFGWVTQVDGGYIPINESIGDEVLPHGEARHFSM